MRLATSILVLVLAGCASPRPRLLDPDGARTLDDLLAARPLAATAPIRADEVGRTPAASVHLIQLRAAETPHVHASHDLAVTMLRGDGVLTVGGRALPMRAGDVSVVPRGTPHWFAPRGTAPAVAFAVFAPPLDAPDVVPVHDVDSPEAAR